MQHQPFETPILFLIFNRPDTTSKVFNAIREIKPKQLFIAADGPRNSEERIRCNEVRDICKNIDWPCELQTLYREENIGCGLAVSGAINWFFTNVEEGIILEDDTLPNKSFFYFCQYILNRYRHDESVMHVAGFNYDFFRKIKVRSSHFFANSIAVWGWATWRRAWKKYDFEMIGFEKIEGTLNCKDHYKNALRKTFEKKIDTWDYQWMYAIYSNNGKAVIPKQNLVLNLGFGSGATHTSQVPPWNNLVTQKELKIGKDSEPILYSDWYEQIVITNTIWEKYSFMQRILLKYKKLLKQAIDNKRRP